MQEIRDVLATWSWLDNWIVITGALTAMACALPGVFLLVRSQAMMGDALSHSVFPGIVIGLMLLHRFADQAGLSPWHVDRWRHGAMFFGALLAAGLAAWLAESLRRWGRTEEGASLGVVFTSFFAFGLLLIRLVADDVHLDPDCVLYGTIETVVLDTVGGTVIPRAALVNGSLLAANALLLVLFFKELRITAFDPQLAHAQGIPPRWFHFGLLTMAALTVVVAFETVGSILVIAMLIAPPATAYLLTDRLWLIIVLSLVIAACSAWLGHVMAITLPGWLFRQWGFSEVVDASTAGMMTIAGGLLLLMAVLLSPRQGLLVRAMDVARLRLAEAAGELLGQWYRWEEDRARPRPSLWHPLRWLIMPHLVRRGLLQRIAGRWELTEDGRREGRRIVRSHRLWETYLAHHLPLSPGYIHDAAKRADRFIDEDLSRALDEELSAPSSDPHGRSIPPPAE